MKQIIFVITILAALSGVSPVLASGGPVFIGPIHSEGQETLADCGAFQVVDVFEADLRITRFFNENGIRERDIRHFSGTDTFTNSVTGKSFTRSFHNNVFIDFDESGNRIQNVNTGVGFRLTVPGVGAVFLDIGRVIYDVDFNVIWEAGPHHFLDGEFDGLCTVLA